MAFRNTPGQSLIGTNMVFTDLNIGHARKHAFPLMLSLHTVGTKVM